MIFRNSLLMVAFMALSVLLVQCKKEGPPGEDGADGTDANTQCLDCHTGEVWNAIESAFDETKHNAGTSWAYAGNRGYCGWCHSDAAYVAFVEDGIEDGIASPMSLKCSSCHSSHTTFDEPMSAPMREPGAVNSIAVEGAVYEHGTGNVCATCHQARRSSTYYDGETEDATYTRTFEGDDIEVYQNAAVGPNGSVTEYLPDSIVVTFDVPVATHAYISSTHAGPHHGVQANMFAADIGTMSGAAFDRDHHTDCASCHLNDTIAAGHSFKPDIESCDECHEGAVDISGMIADNESRLNAIGDALEAKHAIHYDEEGVPHPVYASLERDIFKAWWNFMCVYEDNSMGVHNPAYTEMLLEQAETALGLK